MELELFLVRHAIAEDWSPGGSDDERALTERGRRRFEATVRGLARMDWGLDLVLTSPLVRAVQTAELLRPLLRAGGAVESTPHLARPPRAALLEEAAAVEASGDSVPRVALVGHEPWMGELLGWLLLGEAGRHAGLHFKKGGVALLQGSPRPGSMALAAFVPPRVSRRLGGE